MIETGNTTALGRSLSSYSLQSPEKLNLLKSRLRLGQLIKGRVIDVLPGGKYVFRIQGLNLVAQSMISLKPGMIVFAYVSEIIPKLVLKWAQGKTEKSRLKNGLKQLGVSANRVNRMIAESIFESEESFSSRAFYGIVEKIKGEIQENSSEEEVREYIQKAIEKSRSEREISFESISKSRGELWSDLRKNLNILSANLGKIDINEDKSMRFILQYSMEWNRGLKGTDSADIFRVADLLGLNDESYLFEAVRRGNIASFSSNITLKKSLISFMDRLKSLKKHGFRVQLLNKLLRSADNILRDMDALRLSSHQEQHLVNLFPPMDEKDSGTFLWKGRGDKEYEDTRRISIEFNLEPLGRTIVELSINPELTNVNMMFSKTESGDMARKELSKFSERLEALGLQIGTLNIAGREGTV